LNAPYGKVIATVYLAGVLAFLSGAAIGIATAGSHSIWLAIFLPGTGCIVLCSERVAMGPGRDEDQSWYRRRQRWFFRRHLFGQWT
jgi:hypothetical protein